jgi:hypothetical protein
VRAHGQGLRTRRECYRARFRPSAPGDRPRVLLGIGVYYIDRFGGPEGRLGYPTGPQEYDEARQIAVQDFENGRLYFGADRGALTPEEFASRIRDDCAAGDQRPTAVDMR